MEPRMYAGDVIIIKCQSDVESGELAIVQIGRDTATCKKIMKFEQGVNLVSFNSIYTPMFFSNADIEELPIIVLGRVVELRAKF